MKDWRNYLVRSPRDFETFNMSKTDKTFLSWLAGFTDGEGTFCVQFTPKNGIVLIFCLVNSDSTTMKYVYNRIGLGRLYYQKNPGNEKYKIISRLQITRQKELLLFLPVIIPYLRVKQEEAERMYNFLMRWDGSKTKSERRDILKEFGLVK